VSDFDYGNARLRARKGSLLDRPAYTELSSLDAEGMLAHLAAAAYRPEVEHATARGTGAAALRDAIRSHLARQLEQLRSFYSGRARVLVDVLLSRWDLHNLLTLLRGRATDAPWERTIAGVVAVGAFDAAAAEEVARQPDLDRAVDLLATWRLPNPASARALVRAHRHYLRTEELPELEHALVADHFARATETLRGVGPEAGPVRGEIEREVDRRNALMVVRLVHARETTSEDDEARAAPALLLPGGAIGPERVRAALGASGPGEAAAQVADAMPEQSLADALERWEPEAGVHSLQDELERRSVAASIALFARGNPLGAAIPVAFAAAQAAQATNLRLLAEPPGGGEVARRLIVPEEEQ
jgi:V/A-type H+-transporting ATPase subunit C